MFKKTALVVAMVAGTSAGLVQADGGQVHFTGSVTNSACGIAADSKDMNVVMSTVRARTTVAKEELSAAKSFSITLEDCVLPTESTAAPTISIKFSGTATSENAELFAVSASGTEGTVINGETSAKGLGIAVKFRGTDTVTPNTDIALTNLEFGTGDDGINNVLPFTAQYIATGTKVDAGLANVTSNFTISYE